MKYSLYVETGVKIKVISRLSTILEMKMEFYFIYDDYRKRCENAKTNIRKTYHGNHKIKRINL